MLDTNSNVRRQIKYFKNKLHKIFGIDKEEKGKSKTAYHF